MKHFTSFKKLMLLSLMFVIGHVAFAGSSTSSLTANVADTDTGKGYVYVTTTETAGPDASLIDESHWWTTSSKSSTTQVEKDTHHYKIFGMAVEGFKFVGVKRIIEEGVYADMVAVNEEGYCAVDIECGSGPNIAIYYAVFEETGDPAGIRNIRSGNKEERLYNLNGQCVGEAAKGFMIQNGQKFIRK